jgi:hypothetical protein
MNFKPQTSGGDGQLVTSYGVERFAADWNNPSHRSKRLLAEFLGAVVVTQVFRGGSSAKEAAFALGAPEVMK